MKFPRNARIFKGHLDAAPFASVFFCLLIFVLLASLVYTPGTIIRLPKGRSGQPGVKGPTVKMAMGANGQYYYENKLVAEKELRLRLAAEVKKSAEPLTLVVAADKDVTREKENQLIQLAVAAGIEEILLETQPGMFEPPAKPAPKGP